MRRRSVDAHRWGRAPSRYLDAARRRGRSHLLTFALAALFISAWVPAAASAQVTAGDDPTAIVAIRAAAADCELHVWPAPGMNSMFYGWTHGSTVNGSAKGRNGYPVLPADPLTPAAQLQVLASARLPEKLGRPTTKVIVHEAPLPRTTIGPTRTRRAESTSSCYSELIVEDIFHEEAAFSSKSLRSLFRFRDFGDSLTMTRNFLSWGTAPLYLFPPKDSAKIDEAINELLTAFGASVDDFAGNVLIKPNNSTK